LPCFLSLFNDTPRWVSLEKKKEKRNLPYYRNGITNFTAFLARVSPLVPSLGGPYFGNAP